MSGLPRIARLDAAVLVLAAFGLFLSTISHPIVLRAEQADLEPATLPVNLASAAGLGFGDWDNDGDIDHDDWLVGETCVSGPENPYAAGCAPFDDDLDQDVDLADLRAFQDLYTGWRCPCDTDINGDGILSAMDVAMLNSPACYNRPASSCPQGDLNCSGFVDQADVDIFFFCWNNPLICACDVPGWP